MIDLMIDFLFDYCEVEEIDCSRANWSILLELDRKSWRVIPQKETLQLHLDSFLKYIWKDGKKKKKKNAPRDFFFND